MTKDDQLKKNKKPNEKRVSKAELKSRVEFLLNKEVCQVCEESYDLDRPHHTLQGTYKKDDRSMINICCTCHRILHTKGFATLKKTKEETIKIGRLNNEEYLDEKL